jgi:hypothetical protein
MIPQDTTASTMIPDPEFALGTSRELRMPPEWRNATAADYLAHRVSRSPRDLLAHTQRIGLLAELRDEAGACGALRDLHIALGPAGRGLRDRLLGQCGGLLGSACRESFTGGRAGHRHGTAVLDDAVEGRLDLVSVEAEGPRPYDRLAIAEAELTLGNLAGARELLEEALDDAQTRERALEHLATIYATTADAGRLRAVGARFPEACARVPSWSEARSRLGVA